MEGFLPTQINGLLSKPLKVIPDFRGSFIKLFLNNPYLEEDMAVSTKNVLRGFHFVTEGNRLFTPVYGKLYVAFLDFQDTSKTKYDWFGITIDESNRQSFLIPPFVGCAYLVISDFTVVHYKLELEYDESKQKTIRFDDYRFNVYFPGDHKSYILSERDYFVDEKRIR